MCRSGDISLKTLPAVGTIALLRIGIFGDLGDTLNSSDTLNHLQGNNPDIIYNVGDLSYAGISQFLIVRFREMLAKFTCLLVLLSFLCSKPKPACIILQINTERLLVLELTLA